METVNLLEFLHNTKEIHALDYAVCSSELVNFLDTISEDEQLIKKIDLGIMYMNQRTLDQFTVVDGLNRLLSISLLLHAICECYKKTSEKNDKAIKTIRKKYLLFGNKTKLRLNGEMQTIYEKIIFGERLSGKEKESSIFKLLHNLWSKIKEEGLQAASILKMLNKFVVYVVETANINQRDLYYTLNKERKELNQLFLIENYLHSMNIYVEWKHLKKVYNNHDRDIQLFFKDFFITKYNFKEYNPTMLYDIFVNYFETMLQYMSAEILIAKICRSAELYSQILNVDIQNDRIKHALIRIKMDKGEDTYAYILNIYEDYVDDNISEATFLEILSTIDEYLKNRLKNPNNVSFNELIHYLNAFITCK